MDAGFEHKSARRCCPEQVFRRRGSSRWTKSSFDSSGVAGACWCSVSVDPVIADRGSVARVARWRHVPSRSARHALVTGNHPKVGSIIATTSAPVASAAARPSSRAWGITVLIFLPRGTRRPPRDPPAPMSAVVAIDGDGHGDETRTDSVADRQPRDHPDPGADSGRRRGAQGGAVAVVLGHGPHVRAIPTVLEAMALLCSPARSSKASSPELAIELSGRCCGAIAATLYSAA